MIAEINFEKENMQNQPSIPEVINRKSPSRNCKSAILVCALLFALCVSAQAQQRTQIPRIGFLSALSAPSMAARMEAFRRGLRDLGYVEGENIFLESRYADGQLEHLPTLITELLRNGVDVIVTTGPTTTRPAKEATSTIPIVMGFDSDPVGSGFVASLARPGGNVTGLSAISPEISGKQLELIKEILPKVSRVAVLGNSTTAGNGQSLRETELDAKALGMQIQYLEIREPKDIETAFREASKAHANAVIVLANSATTAHRTEVVQLAAKSRLPAVYYSTEFVEDGGLMTYGVSITDLFRRAATYVDKILKGAKPADLPVEQPTKFELVINLKTAKQSGLTIPPNVLARADRVIR
jgi:putative ABC transport system substrate-binding protein